MEFIQVTKENLEKEHICCAITNNKDVQVLSKKSWLEQRFDEGLISAICKRRRCRIICVKF